MNAAIALILFVLIRIVLFRWADLKAYKRAQKFAPLEKSKQGYYILYQICQVLLLILPFFNRLQLSTWQEYLGIFFYGIGLAVIGLSIYFFIQSNSAGFSQAGIYQFSRHPMYVGYFSFYLGLGLMMSSFLYLVVLMIFQICTHQIILAEEKWCLETFGTNYSEYMKKVRRYL
jgi:protein-S-isoprenylcysteine O-methyltransferase Ste14